MGSSAKNILKRAGAGFATGGLSELGGARTGFNQTKKGVSSFLGDVLPDVTDPVEAPPPVQASSPTQNASPVQERVVANSSSVRNRRRSRGFRSILTSTQGLEDSQRTQASLLGF